MGSTSACCWSGSTSGSSCSSTATTRSVTYFKGVKTLADLRRLFQRKVVPLLQEYFYGDREKVCAVLGCPLDGQTGKSRNRAPLIQARAIAADLDGDGALADAEGRLRFSLSQAFLDADAAALPAFFAGVCGRSS